MYAFTELRTCKTTMRVLSFVVDGNNEIVIPFSSSVRAKNRIARDCKRSPGTGKRLQMILGRHFRKASPSLHQIFAHTTAANLSSYNPLPTTKSSSAAAQFILSPHPRSSERTLGVPSALPHPSESLQPFSVQATSPRIVYALRKRQTTSAATAANISSHTKAL
jgi:hypothetical protein